MLYLLILQFLVLDGVQSHVLDETQTVKISAQFQIKKDQNCMLSGTLHV